MQFNRNENGDLTPLPKPSIDTGMGLERISAVLQGKITNFDTDLFEPIIKDISSLANIQYGSSHDQDTSMRVIADHMRATVFMLSEGLVPSNEGRGYVLRRIIRRAARHAKLLNMHDAYLYRLTDSVNRAMGIIYPEIIGERARTEKLLKIEEENFHRTIDAGMNKLDEIIANVNKEGSKIIPGEEVFKLYDTFGFPYDFAKDIAMDAGLKIDEDTFRKEMELQRERSKVIIGKGKSSIEFDTFGEALAGTIFEGYKSLKVEANVIDILKNGNHVDYLKQGEEGKIILNRTSFYGESGGQVGDIGTIESDNAFLRVLDTKKPSPEVIVHKIKVERGKIAKGEKVICSVDETLRRSTMRNHTATHLLHKALRMTLGDHVKQSGSVVDPERLRFDFTHFQAVQDDEIKKIEDIINEKILEDLPVRTDIMNIEEATRSGAVALFDEKYGETVRVVSVGDFSKELCGGTHCKATGEIGICMVLSEGSVASGIRRIEALTGRNALEYLRSKKQELNEIKGLLKTESPAEKIEKLIQDTKSLEKEIQKLKTGSSRDMISDALKHAQDLDGVKIVNIRQDGLNPNELRLLADNVRDRLKSGIILLSSVIDSQAAIVCMITQDLVKKYSAGEIVKNISKLAGGKGGGKPDMAQGGTKEIEKLDAALESLHEIVKKATLN
jgi:alanyl-tRNA synthetase